jgi:hypothetical protein
VTIGKVGLAGAAPLALLVLLGTTGMASAQSDVEEGRPREAVNMCVERAEEIVRDRDRGRNVEVAEIDEAEEDDDRVTVRGTVRVEDEDGDRRGTADLDCEVDFGGDNRIAAFDEDGLLESLDDGGDRGGRDRDGGRRQEAERAREACREVARDNGWSDIRAEVRDERDDNGRLVLDMTGRRDNFNPERRCRYNTDTNQARFDDPTG